MESQRVPSFVLSRLIWSYRVEDKTMTPGKMTHTATTQRGYNVGFTRVVHTRRFVVQTRLDVCRDLDRLPTYIIDTDRHFDRTATVTAVFTSRVLDARTSK